MQIIYKFIKLQVVTPGHTVEPSDDTRTMLGGANMNKSPAKNLVTCKLKFKN